MLKKIIIATRESPLAMWQAQFIKKLIIEMHPTIEIIIEGFKTEGDILLNEIPFTVDDNWDNDFNRDELEQIKTLWGNNFE